MWQGTEKKKQGQGREKGHGAEGVKRKKTELQRLKNRIFVRALC